MSSATKGLSSYHRVARRLGGRVPSGEDADPAGGGWQKFPTDGRPNVVRAGGGRMSGGWFRYS